MCNAAGACVDQCTPQTSCPGGFDCGSYDPGCGAPPLTCGGACPGARPTCVNNVCTCVPLATCPAGACGSYPNGCGGFLACGGCGGGQVCDGSTSLCRDQTQVEACAGASCGTVTSGSHTYSCGACSAPDFCSNASGGPGTCVCTPISVDCTGKCGPISDGCHATVDCGGCVDPQSCGGGGVPSVCGCTPSNPCATHDCGTYPDGCGSSLVCGRCFQADCERCSGGFCVPISGCIPK
jgi:hypothetical protein